MIKYGTCPIEEFMKTEAFMMSFLLNIRVVDDVFRVLKNGCNLVAGCVIDEDYRSNFVSLRQSTFCVI